MSGRIYAYLIVGVFLCTLVLCSTGKAETNTVSSTSSTVSSTVTDRTVNSAHAPAAITSNQNVCTFGASIGIQTQVLGIASGGSFTDEFCQNLTLSKALYRMNMRVAALSLLCNEYENVFRAMWESASYCPIDGKIGEEAKQLWLERRPELAKGFQKVTAQPEEEIIDEDTAIVGGISFSALLMFLLL